MKIKRGLYINYEKPSPITKMQIFLAVCYIFETKIVGSHFIPENEVKAVEDINHFKFLYKYQTHVEL